MTADCPGSKNFKHPQPGIIECPSCARGLEVWTDEFSVTCPNCKNIILHQQEKASCLDWCKRAKDCVGDKIYTNYMQNKAITIKQKLIRELEDYFGNDTKRVNHAKNVLNFAEEILKQERGEWHIVIPAGVLHDIGIKIAEKKYGSSAGHYQEKEGPEIARNILLRIGLKKEEIAEICEIIAHHHSPGKVDTLNFRILYDADCLVNLKDEIDTGDRAKLREIIDKVFLTTTGKEIAQRIYL